MVVLCPKAKLSKWLLICMFMSLLYMTFLRQYLEQPTAEYFKDSFSKNVTTYINNNPAIILPSSICAGENLIITFVTSAPQNIDFRQAIRETWGSIKTVENYHIKTYFLFGKAANIHIEEMVIQESRTYDDIVLEDFADTYYNLTIKSLMVLKTVNQHCLHNAKYILKADDDVFANLPHLVDNLKQHMRRDYLFMGYEFVDGVVERRRWDKWYVPEDIYKNDTFPPLLSGSAYVFSINLVPKLLEAAIGIPIFHLEDVYVTGFLTKKLNINLTHNEAFRANRIASVPCEYRNLTTTHYNRADEYKKLFEMVYVVGDLDSQCQNYKTRSVLETFLP